MDPKIPNAKLADAARRFLAESIDVHGGRDPIAALYKERRAAYSLFSTQMSDADCEALRPYLFGRPIPRKAGDAPVTCLNLVDGEWRRPAEVIAMKSLADRRVTIHEIARTRDADVEHCLTRAWAYWSSLDWASEAMAYRKHVIKNWSRLMNYYVEECIDELRQETPKTRLEADKDFWEAKRCADHLEGNVEKALAGDVIPQMVPGQTYWKDSYLPAGICAVITPMNFIYGIPGIQIAGCYLSGSPMIFKGHPFSAITSGTLIKMLIAAGADPRAVHKLEGFGGDITGLTSDHRVAVVSVTGSAETAKTIQRGRDVRPVRFEGGGCNWSWIDDGYSDEDLKKIAVRLAYSKLGMGSHKCTGLHGIAAGKATLDRIEPMLAAEMKEWKASDPRAASPTETKVVSPVMVHKASTVTSIQEAAKKAGLKIVLEGGAQKGNEYADNTEVAAPVIIGRVTTETKVKVDWDGAEKEIALATTEFFMPILVTMEMGAFDDFLRFSVMVNPHDLATSIWTRDDFKIQRGRRILGGMLKENDGTDSALEWEEFGASGVGDSGNTGVGDATTTVAMFSRKQKGRHLTF